VTGILHVYSQLSLLVWLNILFPVAFAIKSSVSKRGVEINHISVFSAGFIYYWILPVAIGHYRYFKDAPGMAKWYCLFDSIPENVLATYLLICLCCYFSFVCGTWVARKTFRKSDRRFKDLHFSSRVLNLFLVPCLVPVIYVLAIYMSDFFRGYLREMSTQDGIFASVVLLVFSLAMVYSVKTDTLCCELNKSLNVRRMYCNKFFVIYVIMAFLLLSLGSRLYVISTVLILVIYQSVYRQKIKKVTAFVVLVIGTISMGVVGVLRQGLEISAEGVLSNVVLETIYVGYSIMAFLKYGTWEIIHVPVYLLSALVNLIPSFVLPSKADLILVPDASGGLGGGFSSFVSFAVNFGILGTFMVLFIFSFSLFFLKTRRNSVLFRIMYCCSSGWLAFSFFRDPFSISIIKTILEFSIIIPTLVILGAHLLTVAVREQST